MSGTRTHFACNARSLVSKSYNASSRLRHGLMGVARASLLLQLLLIDWLAPLATRAVGSSLCWSSASEHPRNSNPASSLDDRQETSLDSTIELASLMSNEPNICCPFSGRIAFQARSGRARSLTCSKERFFVIIASRSDYGVSI